MSDDAYLSISLKQELHQLASLLGLESREIDSEGDILAVVAASIQKVERMKNDANAVPSPSPAPAPDNTVNEIRIKARILEEDLRISLKSIGDVGVKARNFKLVTKVRQGKHDRKAMEKSVEKHKKYTRLLTTHVEKLLKALRIESGKRVKALERVRVLEGAKRALDGVVAGKVRAMATQERLVRDVAKGSLVLQDQLTSMDEQYLALKRRFDMLHRNVERNKNANNTFSDKNKWVTTGRFLEEGRLEGRLGGRGVGEFPESPNVEQFPEGQGRGRVGAKLVNKRRSTSASPQQQQHQQPHRQNQQPHSPYSPEHIEDFQHSSSDVQDVLQLFTSPSNAPSPSPSPACSPHTSPYPSPSPSSKAHPGWHFKKRPVTAPARHSTVERLRRSSSADDEAATFAANARIVYGIDEPVTPTSPTSQIFSSQGHRSPPRPTSSPSRYKTSPHQKALSETKIVNKIIYKQRQTDRAWSQKSIEELIKTTQKW